MNKKKILNWTMFLSMIVVYLSGFLIKINRGFLILHALSSVALLVCMIIHMAKNRMFSKSKKNVKINNDIQR